MSLITRMRKGTAVYWARSTRDAYGQWTFASPVQISVRWEWIESLHQSDKGEKWMSNSTVYVDRDMSTGDWLFDGTIQDLTSESIPQSNSGAFQVKKFEKVPTLRYNEYLRTAYL